MNKALVCSFIVASLNIACSEHPNSSTQAKDIQTKSAIDPKLMAWVGEYSGVIPCATCISRCPDCESMGIDLHVFADQSFKLTRTSYSGHNEPEIFTGKFDFMDHDKLKIQLINLKERNTLILGQDYLEIIDQKTQTPYQAQHDFQIQRKDSKAKNS